MFRLVKHEYEKERLDLSIYTDTVVVLMASQHPEKQKYVVEIRGPGGGGHLFYMRFDNPLREHEFLVFMTISVNDETQTACFEGIDRAELFAFLQQEADKRYAQFLAERQDRSLVATDRGIGWR